MPRERLTPGEEELLAAVDENRDADLGRDIDPRSAAHGEVWPADRVVRAHILERLLRGDGNAPRSAIGLTGARISGSLRLANGELTRALRLDTCWFDDAIALSELETSGIELVRCRLPGFRSEAVDVRSALTIRECDLAALVMIDTTVARSATFEDTRIRSAAQPLVARNVSIGGNLQLNRARIFAGSGNAVYTEGLRIGGALGLVGARVRGGLQLGSAVVGGQVDATSVVIRNGDATAFHAPHLAARGVSFRSARCTGGIDLRQATIEGVLALDDAVVAARTGPSIVLSSATVDGDLAAAGLRCWGTVDIKAASVGGGVWLRRAQLDGTGGVALAGSKCTVSERFTFDRGAVAIGDIDLAMADVGKSVAMDHASVLGRLRLFQAHVRSDVLLRGAYIEADGIGVDAIGLKVDGRFTGRGMVCDGSVRLTAAVADSLVLSAAQIYHPEGNALIATRVDVGGDLVLGEDPYSGSPGALETTGGVVLRDSRVGGDVIFDGAQLTHRGHRVVDATSIEVGGKFSLERVVAEGAAVLDKAQVRRRIVVIESSFAGHGIGSTDGMVVLSALQAASDEMLFDGGTFAGAVRLTGATISVGLSMRDVVIIAPDGVAIVAADLISGEIHLSNLDVTGSVVLGGSALDGDLSVEGGTYRRPGAPALDAARLVAAGAVSLTDVDLVGALVLRRAEIGLDLILTRVRISVDDPGADESTNGLNQAIAAPGLRVEGSIECRQLATEGQVSLVDAIVSGRLLLRRGCSLAADQIPALYAPGIRVVSDVELGWERADAVDLVVSGEVKLDRAKLGSLSFNRALLTTNGDAPPGQPTPQLALREAEVDRQVSLDTLAITGPASAHIDLAKLRAGLVELPQGDVEIDLNDATVGTMVLDPSDSSAVRLSGLTFDDPGKADVHTALEWVRRDPTGLQHNAYEQLAAHYRRQGDEASARTVLLTRQRHHRSLMRWSNPGQFLMKAWGYLQDATVGYGYRPGLAAIWFAGLLAAGTIYFFIDPVEDPVEVGVHPHFNAFGYTLDLLIPLVTIGQDLAWDPHKLQIVVAYGLTFAGGVLATTIAAAVTRVLARR